MWKLIIAVGFFSAAMPFAFSQPSPDQFQVIGAGVCEDVNLPCVKMVSKDTEFFYAIFKDGKLVAVTKVRKDGIEEVIWGDLKLPLKPNEKEL